MKVRTENQQDERFGRNQYCDFRENQCLQVYDHLEKLGISAANGTTDPPPNQIVISYDDLSALGIRYSKEHLRRLERDGLFPKRVPLTACRVAWVREEVIGWLRAKTEARA